MFYFLLNASPYPFDIAKSTFQGPWVTSCEGYPATFCVTMAPRLRSKVKKRVFGMVYRRLHSSFMITLYQCGLNLASAFSLKVDEGSDRHIDLNSCTPDRDI